MYLLYDLFCLTQHGFICQILNAMTWKGCLQSINANNLPIQNVFIVLINKMTRISGYTYRTLTYFDVISYALPLICNPLSDDVDSSQGCHMLMDKYALKYITAFELLVSALSPVQHCAETPVGILCQLECLYYTLPTT